MNEEEKKAIDKLQYTIEINQNILDGIEIDEQVIKSMETTLNLIEKQQKEIENIKEYINSPEFLDWNLGFKLIDELEYRKDRINELLGE